MLQLPATDNTSLKYGAACGMAWICWAICARLGGGEARKLRRYACASGDAFNCAAAPGSVALSAAITCP